MKLLITLAIFLILATTALIGMFFKLMGNYSRAFDEIMEYKQRRRR